MKGKLVIASYVYSNNLNTANNNDLSVIPPGSLDPGIINFPIPNPGIEKRLRDCNPYLHRGRGTSADIVPTQIIFGVDSVQALLRYRSKTAKMQKFPIDSHSNTNFISPFFRPPWAANPQKGRRHIRNQSTPGCKIWRELVRGLSRNR